MNRAINFARLLGWRLHDDGTLTKDRHIVTITPNTVTVAGPTLNRTWICHRPWTRIGEIDYLLAR